MTRKDADMAGVVLAAGAGRRLGQPKAGLALAGQLLVNRAVATLADAGCAPVLAVLGAEAERIAVEAKLDPNLVVDNPRWESGLASSLAVGLQRLQSTPVTATVIALVDQPLITAAAVARLVAVWRDSGPHAVTATFGGSPRPPVVLARSVWAEVVDSAAGDTGARAWLQANPDQVIEVACDDVARPDDLDTPHDLQRLRREHGWN